MRDLALRIIAADLGRSIALAFVIEKSSDAAALGVAAAFAATALVPFLALTAPATKD
ncbi:MAG: hypothetical protein JO228_10290 [Xanthobacteraceae bacterium]|nr:hypothetical protein [Xanthobacteraceae bacterium]